MPISKTRNAVALAAAFCFGPGALVPAAQARSFTPLPGPPVTQVSVQDGAITITGPAGYCLDSSATRERSDGVFVMLGNCTRLYRHAQQSPEISAVLTALVSAPSDAPQSPSPDALERYFRSEDGRAALSVDNRAETVEIQEGHAQDGVLLLQLRDSSTERPAGLSDSTWRAVFALGNRLVSLAVTAHVEEPIDTEQSRQLLNSFIAAMQAANPSPPEATAPARILVPEAVSSAGDPLPKNSMRQSTLTPQDVNSIP